MRALLSIMILVAILPATTLAQTRAGKRGGHNGERFFQRADKNGDGQISRDEWLKRPKAFDRIDQNHDGFISREEAQTAARHRAARLKKHGGERATRLLDKNNDGQIARDEWVRNPKAFDRLDANHDGVITRDEMSRARSLGRGVSGPDTTTPTKPPRT